MSARRGNDSRFQAGVSVDFRREETLGGIRLALGAPAEAVWRLIVGDGLRLAAVGVALALAGAAAVTRTLRSLLFEVSATEPAVFAIAALALAGVAIAASWIPGHAATRVDPVTTILKT
ncbi:MAG TPA: FtsX-like permease family protein [Vicinamibacterales bacterium]|nr:FtsX-like permease family protein [Vicinamibacterales bacterium]